MVNLKQDIGLINGSIGIVKKFVHGYPVVEFENGVEHLAKDVRLIGETFTECTHEHGETKWNIACFGRLVWVDQVAVIVTSKD